MMTRTGTIALPAPEVIAAEAGDEIAGIVTARQRARLHLDQAHAVTDQAEQSRRFRAAVAEFNDAVERVEALHAAYWPRAERIHVTEHGDVVAVIGRRPRQVYTACDHIVCEDVVALPAIACVTDAVRHVCGRPGAHAGDHECQHAGCGAVWPQVVTG